VCTLPVEHIGEIKKLYLYILYVQALLFYDDDDDDDEEEEEEEEEE
jgi:hypothetical protein